MKITDALRGFELYANSGAYSPLTYAPYKAAILKLAAHLDDPEVGQVTENDLLGFMAYLRSEYHAPRTDSGSLSEASMHRYWKAMRSFFTWSAAKLSTGRPDLALTIPRYDSKEIVPFSRDEVKRLLVACETSEIVKKRGQRAYHMRRPTAQRDRAIIRLLLDTGIRVGELCRLRIVDINLDTSSILVLPHRKGKTRSRSIPIGGATKQDLWAYLAHRKKTDGEYRDNDPLFVVESGGSLARYRVEAIITYLAARAHVPGAHPHRFRHTFAIEYLRNGGDVFTLQRILGHATMQMIKVYLAIAEADVEVAHRRASPVDNWRL